MSLLAVYGTLNQNNYNHFLLEESEYLGKDVTEPEWTMYDLGPYPCISPNGKTPITIEVYKINERINRTIDRLEGYPHYYDKKEINTRFGPAIVYFINDIDKINHPIRDIITSGEW